MFESCRGHQNSYFEKNKKRPDSSGLFTLTTNDCINGSQETLCVSEKSQMLCKYYQSLLIISAKSIWLQKNPLNLVTLLRSRLFWEVFQIFY